MSRPSAKKAYVLVSIFWISTSLGFIYGQIPGMISALQKNEDGINLSENEISLIASTNTMFTILGFALVAVINEKIGRRWSFTIISIPFTLNWIILYFAKSVLMFVISRIIAGITVGALTILYIVTTSEYTSPKPRVFFLNMITTVAPAIGTSLGHFLGMILHWRSVALIGTFFALIGSILPLFWVESPHWLATQGRFEECQLAFRKLNVITPESEKELRILIKMENSKLDKATETNTKSPLKRLFLALKRKYFWELIIITIAMYVYCAAGAKLLFSTLATVMLEEMTQTSDVMLFTLSVDISTIIGSVLSCVLVRRTSMRSLLFSTGFTANTVLFILSICLYFKNNTAYSQWLNVCLLGLYFILVHAGPFPIIEALVGEIFPSDLKMYFLFLTTTILVCFLGASIMLLPHMIDAMGYYGFFFINAVIMTVSLVYLWIKLPETKGKTLQEIEVYFKVKDFDVDKALDNEQMKALI